MFRADKGADRARTQARECRRVRKHLCRERTALDSQKTPQSKSGSKADARLREWALRIINTSLEEARTQHPLDIPDAFRDDRPTLGASVPVSLYRAVRLLSFRDLLGAGLSSAMLHLSGRTLADKLGVSGLDAVLRVFSDLRIANLDVERSNGSTILIAATECATCSGLPNIGEAVCSFEAGILAGGLKHEFGGDAVTAVEKKCCALGDACCLWEIAPADGNGNGHAEAEPLDLIAAMAGKAALALDGALAIKEANCKLRQAHKQLRESERMTHDLTNMVVHDLRVPLTAVIGSLQMIAESAGGKLDPNEKELLSLATAGGDTLLQMICDLLDVGKLEERRLVLHRRPTWIADVLNTARRQIEVLARRKKLSLKFADSSNLPMLSLDSDRIVRVLVNLIGNAIRHTPSGGRITVKTGFKDGHVVVSVGDTGEGIPPEDLARIFDKFVQVSAHRSRRSYSTGLGLTFCKLAVEAHGGRIWAESELGKGSTFTFTLPVQA